MTWKKYASVEVRACEECPMLHTICGDEGQAAFKCGHPEGTQRDVTEEIENVLHPLGYVPEHCMLRRGSISISYALES